MKRLYKFFAFAFVVLAFASCNSFEDENSPSSEQEEKTIVELPDSVKRHLIEQDSLISGLVNKIDKLRQELNEVKGTTSQLQPDVEKLESPKSIWNYLTLGALILAIISLIMVLAKSRGLNENEVEGIFKDCLTRSSRFNNLQEKVDRLINSRQNSNNTPNSSYALQRLEDRVKSLELQLNKIQQVKSCTGNSQLELQRIVQQTEAIKIGYAKSNSGKYFFDILDFNQEGCVYSIKFVSNTKGEFDLISLNKIKSRNDWQSVIDWEGDVNVAEASSYKLIRCGIVEKIDETTWEVKDNLKIRFLK